MAAANTIYINILFFAAAYALSCECVCRRREGL